MFLYSQNYTIYYYRDQDKNEVDFVIANRVGHIVGIEVKSAASVSANDLKGLKKLAASAKKSFIAGVILYDGNETLPLGDRLWAIPISTLWK